MIILSIIRTSDSFGDILLKYSKSGYCWARVSFNFLMIYAEFYADLDHSNCILGYYITN